MRDFTEIITLQEELAKEYKYQALPGILSMLYRDEYKESVPVSLNLDGASVPLFSCCGMKIARSYERIVIGDYGAFVEISADNIISDNIEVKKGQEFRIFDPQYKDNVKYHWLTAKDNSNCKIYFQQKTVDYADYKPGFYYISPYEVKTEKDLTLDDRIQGSSNTNLVKNQQQCLFDRNLEDVL